MKRAQQKPVKGKDKKMAKVTNTTDEKQKLGQHEIHPKGSVDVQDHELEQHKQDPATKKLFDSGKLKEESGGATGSSQGYGGAGSTGGQGSGRT